MNIPKLLRHIWVGPKSPPLGWMNTWKKIHPDWEYRIFSDEDLKNRKFHNQHLIDEYYRKSIWHGVADLVRYELLYEEGGFMPGADSVCFNNVEELFTEDEETCYTVYENEILRPGLVSPILGSPIGAPFLKFLIDDLHKLRPEQLREPWKTTGNGYLAKVLKKSDKVKVFPSHYFIPEHWTKKLPKYSGPDKIYCEQMWGTTKGNYEEGVKNNESNNIL